MTGAEIAQIILALATFVTAAGGVLIGILNSQKINEVHKLANSNLLKVEEVARAAGVDQGNLQGRAEQTEERRVEATEKGKA